MRSTHYSSRKPALVVVFWLALLNFAHGHHEQAFLVDAAREWQGIDHTEPTSEWDQTPDSLGFHFAAHQFVLDGRALVLRPFGWTAINRKKFYGAVAITAGALALDPWFNNILKPDRSAHEHIRLRWLEAAGNGSLYLPLSAIIWSQGRAHRDAQQARLGVGLASAVIWSRLLIQIPKYAFQRERPQNGGDNPYVFHGPFGGFAHDAFPSGHTTTAFAAAAYLRKVKPFNKAWPGQAASILAWGTAYQRVQSGRHWLADVGAGAIIGHVCGSFLAKRVSSIQISASPIGAHIIIPMGQKTPK
ncbi:MAG: phosphatase PAP2 family protein [Bacteroidetes bacterium]|nr:phosphatase PAP2 family protein [Bacteroidota bacterium]